MTVAAGGKKIMTAAIVTMILTCVIIRTRHGDAVVGVIGVVGVLIGEPFLNVIIVAHAVGAGGVTWVVGIVRNGVRTVLAMKQKDMKGVRLVNDSKNTEPPVATGLYI